MARAIATFCFWPDERLSARCFAKEPMSRRSMTPSTRRARSPPTNPNSFAKYSMFSREPEAEILPAVRELGISVTAYGILSRGLLSSGTARLAPGDPRTRFPRFSGDNHARNLELLASLEEIAAGYGVTA